MSEFVLFFFDLTNNIKLYHWTTSSFSRHKGADGLFDDITGLADKFMETYMGKYGRPTVNERASKLTLKPLNDKNVVEYLRQRHKILREDLSKLLKNDDTDLINIRDDILAKLSQTLYLFTLH
jgi:hypothetical protein